MQQEQQENQFKVAPIISDEKYKELISLIVQTVFGVSKTIGEQPVTIVWSIILPLVLYLIPMFVGNVYIAIILPSIIIVIINAALEVCKKDSQFNISKIIVKHIIIGAYCALWSNHIFVLSQYYRTEIYLFVLSAVSIITSIYTICIMDVKQFGASGVENSKFDWNSTAFMRFFIVFPTLFAQITYYNSANMNPDSIYLYPLRCCSSLVFLIWWFGWMSSIKNTLYIICNKISMIIFGQESQSDWGNSAISILINLAPIAVYQGIYSLYGISSMNPLIAGATISSLLMFLKASLTHKKINPNYSIRPFIFIQLLFGLLLCLLYSIGNLQNVSLTLFLSIDIGLYFGFSILKQFYQGWSRFGFNLHFTNIRYSNILQIQRYLLRIFSGISILIIMNNQTNNFLTLFNYESNIVGYIVIPFLGYRSFKRSISETRSFSLHISLLICLVAINTSQGASGCLLVLMMPPFPPNAYLTFASIFMIPPKAKHKNQCSYQVIYTILTVIGLCIHYLSLGILEPTMIFGLPIYLPILSTETDGYQVKSLENSLYQKIIQNINSGIFQFYQTGYYLLRIEKYIILLEIKSSCYGFCEIVDFRGLQVQEVTSCHSKEGQTIDRMVQQTWGDNHKCCTLSPYQTAISPFLKEKIYVPTENDIQLTGIIQSKQFIKLFKEIALKSILRQYTNIKLNENQKKQAQVIISELSAFYKKEGAESIFPFQFGKHFNINASYPIQTGKKKLPPISKKGGKKDEVINDFLDLLESSHEPFQKSMTGLNEKQKQSKESQHQLKKQLKQQETNMAIILTLYYYSVGKLDYINTEKLYKIIKKQTDTITQIDFQGFEKLLSIALGTAFKISIDKYINGQFQVNIEDFVNYDKNCYLGTSDSQEFKQAMFQDKQDIWTINYNKKNLGIKRMARSQTNMYIFKVSEVILKSVWNNLRFELIYATNDNDQRYSIQTHPTLLRNLWIQACQQPFGYPGYHSGYLMNI